jgi:hypothetical protein
MFFFHRVKESILQYVVGLISPCILLYFHTLQLIYLGTYSVQSKHRKFSVRVRIISTYDLSMYYVILCRILRNVFCDICDNTYLLIFVLGSKIDELGKSDEYSISARPDLRNLLP